MEPLELITDGDPRAEAPFAAASRFGISLALPLLPGWSMSFAFDGTHTYMVWTDGELTVRRRAPQA